MSAEEDAKLPEETMWAGRYIVAKRRGRWEYVGRQKAIGAAVIVALDEGHLLLVEQHRVPLGRRSLELPAGLVGDDADGEDIATAATRELEEECGYWPGRIEILGEFASSPGMVSETFTLVRAYDLVRTGEGGGVDRESIEVLRVPLADVPALVAAKRVAGVAIDVKLLLALGAELLA